MTAFERKTRAINELGHNNVMVNYTNILKKKEWFLKEVERVKEDIYKDKNVAPKKFEQSSLPSEKIWGTYKIYGKYICITEGGLNRRRWKGEGGRA